MKTNRHPPTPAPVLVVAGTTTSSSGPTAVPLRVMWPWRPGSRGHGCGSSLPVICIVVSPSRAAGILFCKEGEGQRQMGWERELEGDGERSNKEKEKSRLKPRLG